MRYSSSSLASMALLVFGIAPGYGCGCSRPEPVPTQPGVEFQRALPDEVHVSEQPPPPISGGTLLVTVDREYAVAADPDRDRVWLAPMRLANGSRMMDAIDARVQEGRRGSDLLPVIGPMESARHFQLAQGSEPGRVVQAGTDEILVVLRGQGEVLSLRIEEDTLQENWRTRVCNNPRGLAYDASERVALVLCRDGQLASLSGETGLIAQRIQLPIRDLRDLVIDERRDLYVSTFRSAKVYRLNRAGAILNDDIDLTQSSRAPDRTPSVAWRMRPQPGGGVIVAHQLARTKQDIDEPVPVSVGGYGGSTEECRGENSIVLSAISSISARALQVDTMVVPGAVLPVDVLRLRSQIGLAAAGAVNEDLIVRERDTSDSGRRGLGEPSVALSREVCSSGVIMPQFHDGRQVVALDVLRETEENAIVLVQTRDPWALELQVLDGEMAIHPELETQDTSTTLSVSLPGPDRRDTGSDLFHEDSGLGIACASCHPEGSDDAQVWEFAGLGLRRTPQLSGGILAETAPFHWIGDMSDFSHLSHEVFSSRMGGPELPPEYVARMASWIDTIEPPKPSNLIDPEQVARGAAVFYSSETGCASCHSGGLFTNNETVDVGTGLALQVPPLVGLDGRSGFMHTGCAETLMDRFTDEECGGGDRHGKTSHLDDGQLSDLVTFLRTL